MRQLFGMIVLTHVRILYKKKYEAARIVTGLTRLTRSVSLFKESGWQSMKDRRETQKMYFVYKTTHQMIPQYTADLITSLVADTTQYALTNDWDLKKYLLVLQFHKNLAFLLQYIFGII